MNTILDIHTHHTPPLPEAVVSVSADEFDPIEGQLYSVGIHPWLTLEDIAAESWQRLEEAAANSQVVAIGECGIDLIKGGPLYRQMQVFRRQVSLSEKLGKPLVVHCVHAHDIVIGMKKDIVPVQKWLVHGFRGKPTVAEMFIKAGIGLSFGKNYNERSVKEVPLDMLYAETDEADITISEVITGLSALTGQDLTDRIITNSGIFLGLSDTGQEIQH